MNIPEFFLVGKIINFKPKPVFTFLKLIPPEEHLHMLKNILFSLLFIVCLLHWSITNLVYVCCSYFKRFFFYYWCTIGKKNGRSKLLDTHPQTVQHFRVKHMKPCIQNNWTKVFKWYNHGFFWFSPEDNVNPVYIENKAKLLVCVNLVDLQTEIF